MKAKYSRKNFNISKLSNHNIDKQALNQIEQGSFVFDVGCATGFMGNYLKRNRKCKVWGLDIRKDEGVIATKMLDKFILGSIEDDDIVKKILEDSKFQKFDYILALSIIEHLPNPEKAIYNMLKLLKPTGKLIVSTPNIAHWSIRLMLLHGNFDYSDYGILDNTHLKFFTLKSFKNLLRSNNVEISSIKIDAEGGGYPKISIFLSRFFPSLFAYQMLIVVTKSKG